MSGAAALHAHGIRMQAGHFTNETGGRMPDMMKNNYAASASFTS